MAFYNITYKCGHTYRKELYGKIESRYSYIEWAKYNKICPECEDKLRAENIRKENESSRQIAQESGCIELQGTEKQVSWANSIRYKAVKYLDEFKNEAESRFTEKKASKDMFDKLNFIIDDIRNRLLSIDNAKTFIEHYKNISKEDFRCICRVKTAIGENLIIDDDELDQKMREYDIARIEKREAVNPVRLFMGRREADAYIKNYPELFH